MTLKNSKVFDILLNWASDPFTGKFRTFEVSYENGATFIVTLRHGDYASQVATSNRQIEESDLDVAAVKVQYAIRDLEKRIYADNVGAQCLS